MTDDETARWKGKKPSDTQVRNVVELDTSSTAGSIDWRQKGAVNPV
jgi:hypothetical protein